MESENLPLEELAEAVLEGHSVDWASVESSAGAPDREAIRQLKVLAGIAELHRNLAYDTAESAWPEVPEGRLERWGRLEILECIGRGSFGEVYRAWDSKLDREVAVKLLHADRARPEGATVLKEARLLARVRHPNVVTVYDADEIEGRVGLWMEFIHGKNLEEILGERKRLEEREVTRIGIELCRALSAVHEAGLLHRDIKPQNLMQAGDGRLVLMDFGMGRELEHTPAVTVDAAGTPLYLAPELFDGAEATVRSDIYSAGVVLFHLLTGAFPVLGTTVREVSEAQATGRRVALAERAPGASRPLAAVIDRALRPDPSERFESASDMVAALENLTRRAEAVRRKRYWLALGTVSLVAVALAVAQSNGRRPEGRGAGGGPYFGTTPEKREVQTPLVLMPGTPSPDGRYLPYAEMDTANLALYEFATGTSRTLTNSGDGGHENYAEESIVSADSSQIAYAWNDGSCECVQLRVIDAAGANVRVLANSKNPTAILPLEWSLDGSQILGTRQRSSGETEVILISTTDGSIHSVRTLTFRPWHVSLSPDSRYIAYDRAEDSSDTDRGIYLSTIDGSQEIPIVTGPAYDSHPMWTPEGSGLVFASLRTGGPGIWLQPIKDGRADGKPRLLDKDVGPFDPITLTRRGSLFYRHRTGLMDVYTVPIDPATGDVRGDPTVVARRFLGSNISPDWSPDGGTLVFASWRTLFGPGQNILVLHSMNTGVEQELEVDLARVNGPRWSSDGRSLFVYGPDRKELNGLRLLDVETGSVSGPYLTRAGDVPPVTALAWGPDGRHAYLKRDRQRISGIDVGTGEEKVLYQAPADSVLGTLAVSPDGGSIAFDVYLRAEHRFRLFVIPTGGGTPRELLDASGPDRVNPEGWTHDGRQLLFVRTSSNAPERKHVGELWAVASEGGPARRLGLSMPALRDVSVSPAGDRIAFTSGYPDTGIWVFENFLPRTVSR